MTNLASAPRVLAVFYNNPDSYPPIVNSARLLVRAGLWLELCCRENGQSWGVAYPPGVQVRRIDTRGGSSWREFGLFVRRALRLERRRRLAGQAARVFVGHDMHGFLVARLLAWRYRRPLVYHCHDYADAQDARRITERGVLLARSFEQRFARTASLVIVPDAARAEVMARELRLGQAPIIVANAPLLSAWPPQQPSRSLLREALRARGYNFDKVVLRQGKIGWGHAIEPTIDSMPRWKSRAWGLALMGPGDAPYIAELQARARALGVQGQLAVLPPVGYDEIAAFTCGADIGHALYQPIHVNNVHIATASNKVMEYMASGVALLASDGPGLRHLMQTYGCGLTADESSPESIAQAVNALLGDEESSRQMARAGRRAFEEVFCYEKQFEPALQKIKALAASG